MPPSADNVKRKNPRYQFYLHPGCNTIESLILSVYYYRARYDKPVTRRYIEGATGLSHTTIVKTHKDLVSKGLLDASRSLIAQHPLSETYLYFDSGLCKSLKFNEILILGAVKIIVARHNHKKDRKTKTAPISDSDISRLTGIPNRTIKRARPRLVAGGYIDHIPHKSGSTWQLLDKGPARRPGPNKPANKPAGRTTTKIDQMLDEFKKLCKKPILDTDLPTLVHGLERLYTVWKKIPKQYTHTTMPSNFGPRAIVRTMFNDLGLAFVAPITLKQDFLWQKLNEYLIENGYQDAV